MTWHDALTLAIGCSSSNAPSMLTLLLIADAIMLVVVGVQCPHGTKHSPYYVIKVT